MTKEKLSFIKNGNVYSTLRFKRGHQKQFTIEKEKNVWCIYTKAKDGNWIILKQFPQLASAKLWLQKYITMIDVRNKKALHKLLKRA